MANERIIVDGQMLYRGHRIARCAARKADQQTSAEAESPDFRHGEEPPRCSSY